VEPCEILYGLSTALQGVELPKIGVCWLTYTLTEEERGMREHGVARVVSD